MDVLTINTACFIPLNLMITPILISALASAINPSPLTGLNRTVDANNHHSQAMKHHGEMGVKFRSIDLHEARSKIVSKSDTGSSTKSLHTEVNRDLKIYPGVLLNRREDNYNLQSPIDRNPRQSNPLPREATEANFNLDQLKVLLNDNEDLQRGPQERKLIQKPLQHALVPTEVNAPVITKRDDECRGGFSVRKAHRFSLKAETQIKFQDILTNAGGWYSEIDKFIPPCAGIYFFSFNAVSEEGVGFTLALMKNDKYQVTAYGGKAGYQWGSNSAMLFLNKGDEVYLQLQDGTIYEHPYNEAYTTFTGFLVKEF